MSILGRSSFILGLLLMMVMLVVFKELVGVLIVMSFLGLSLQGIILVVIDLMLLLSIPSLMMEWAPLVDSKGDNV